MDKALKMKADTEAINRVSLVSRVKAYKRSKMSFLLLVLVVLSAVITIGVFVLLVGYILISGIPHLTLELFEWNYTAENGSMMPAIINTLIMTVFSLALAVPVGVASAIYLSEYASKVNKLVSVIRLTTETLSGIPSIVYGLFGYIFFVITLGWSYSLIAGAITLAIMILPIIMRTTEEALMSVPDSFREGSFGLGAGKLRTISKIVLPSAMPGILAGVVLSIGRIVGESAALIFTAGTYAAVPTSVFSSARTLSVHMYALWNEGLASEKAQGTAVVLLFMVIGINALSKAVAGRISNSSGRGGK